MDSSIVYKYFTLVPDQAKDEISILYYCNICKENGRLSKTNEPIICKSYKNSTSNLIAHLRTDKLKNHSEALKLIENSSSSQVSKKRKVEFLNSPTLVETGSIKIVNKYPQNSQQQNEQYVFY